MVNIYVLTLGKLYHVTTLQDVPRFRPANFIHYAYCDTVEEIRQAINAPLEGRQVQRKIITSVDLELDEENYEVIDKRLL